MIAPSRWFTQTSDHFLFVTESWEVLFGECNQRMPTTQDTGKAALRVVYCTEEECVDECDGIISSGNEQALTFKIVPPVKDFLPKKTLWRK